MVFFSSGSQCWYFSHEPSSLFHHSVLVDLSVSTMMHCEGLLAVEDVLKPPGSLLATDSSKAVVLV